MPYTTLIQADELIPLLDQPDCRVIDCRHDLAQPDAGEAAYRQGYIPGALFLHLDRDLSGPKTGRNGRHPLPDPAELAARLGLCGIGPGTQVVAYDDHGGMFAVRLWWLLRWLGHDTVAVLDGGLGAWRKSGQSLVQGSVEYAPALFNGQPSELTLTADDILRQIEQPRWQLLDARAPDRFRGENETLDPVGGRIPGALNRFFRSNLDAEGRFKSAKQLRQDFTAVLGEREPEQVVHQCGSGVTACHNLLAMEVAGLKGSRLYPGSWSEWCSDPARPILTGA
ncbi:MAG TPA: sulfurtransferase [Dongiaceae bacterium]|nr:sulfurtransferase [Dongiaceae bacterium]